MRALGRALLFGGSLVVAAACGSGGGSGSGLGIPGQEQQKPDGSLFFVDQSRGGTATRLHLVEMFWARLVDVHDVDDLGRTNAQPIFSDFTINENVQSDGTNYLLETNPITQKTRLVILRTKGVDDGTGTFDGLLRDAASGLPPITPKHDDGTSPAPFSFVARNSTLILRFDDVLKDDARAERELVDSVHVLTGYPPITPFGARLRFDPNHGALVGGRFHSTRVLIDLTVSEEESAGMAVPQAPNSIGLPASLTFETQPNVSIRIPTRLDPSIGQFTLLRGLSGVPLAVNENGPVDRSKGSFDIVRALRAGNAEDQNNGFLLDLNQPEIVGAWPTLVTGADHDPLGTPGFDFVIDATFSTACRVQPEVGDVLSVGDLFVEVQELGSPPNTDGEVPGLKVRVLSDDPVEPQGLIGNALFLSTFDPAEPVPNGCWVSFTPQPGIFPVSDISTNAQVLLRFSEPMDPASLTPFDSFMIVRGDSNTVVFATNIVVGDVDGSPDLKDFTFSPRLPFAHTAGQADIYHVRIDGPTDLAGNALANPIAPIEFGLKSIQPTVANGGTVLRFNSPDEVEPIGPFDLRGQLFYDIDRGVIKPRPVGFVSYPADRTIPLPSIMIAFPQGVQTPLTPLGSKLQALWRYCDLGWQVRDETKYNLDVFGLNWSPIEGRVVSDFFERFEIRLSHSARIPDERLNGFLLPAFTGSGLVGGPRFFTDNILDDPPGAGQKVVHPGSLGYKVDPVDLFLSSTGTVMMPYPLNRTPGVPKVTYTWRDTSLTRVAGPGGVGIPLSIEVGSPLFLDPGPPGGIAAAGLVPSFGLPLLMEYRCYPTVEGIGLNAFDISLAINSSPHPAFRCFSTGGINSASQPVQVNPDLELVPAGAFNPRNGGRRTPSDDNSFYIGQLDVVIRVSRVHTVWIDTNFATANYFDPVILPLGSEQPAGTEVIVEFRGATGFSGALLTSDAPFDAAQLNPYGHPFIVGTDGLTQLLQTIHYKNGVDTWSTDIDTIDGSEFVQMRYTFLNNIATGLNPELSAVGIAYSQ